ncbi:hypothetical protein FQZ97_1186140 [compost metagenome]
MVGEYAECRHCGATVAKLPGLDVRGIENDADVMIMVQTFRRPPVLREAAVLVVLDGILALEQGTHLDRIFGEADLGFACGMRLDGYAQLFRDEFADGFATPVALRQSIEIDAELGLLETGLVLRIVVV